MDVKLCEGVWMRRDGKYVTITLQHGVTNAPWLGSDGLTRHSNGRWIYSRESMRDLIHYMGQTSRFDMIIEDKPCKEDRITPKLGRKINEPQPQDESKIDTKIVGDLDKVESSAWIKQETERLNALHERLSYLCKVDKLERDIDGMRAVFLQRFSNLEKRIKDLERRVTDVWWGHN